MATSSSSSVSTTSSTSSAFFSKTKSNAKMRLRMKALTTAAAAAAPTPPPPPPPHVIVRPTPRKAAAAAQSGEVASEAFVTNVSIPEQELELSKERSMEEALRQANFLPSVKLAIETLTLNEDGDAGLGVRASKGHSTHVDESKSKLTMDADLTCADEFVWLDTHNRLVELQQVPWSPLQLELLIKHTLLSYPVCRSMNTDLVPRLSYYLQRVLVRVARECQRLASTGFCCQSEIETALRLVLAPALALAAYSAVVRAVAMYCNGNHNGVSRRHKGDRAGIVGLDVGQMHRWMVDVNLATIIDDLAAVALTAVVASVVQELVSLMLSSSSSSLSSSILESVVSNDPDVFGCLQPLSHLSSSRVNGGSLVLSPVLESLLRRKTTTSNLDSHLGMRTKETNGVRQVLLTTCVGSKAELKEMVQLTEDYLFKMWNSAHFNSGSVDMLVLQAANKSNHVNKAKFTQEALDTLFYFMRCSQLQYATQDHQRPIQELEYERPYMVLPPIIEWVRVSVCFAQHLRSSAVVEAEDVQQTARLLLPGVDCPPISVVSTKVFNEDEGLKLKMEMVLKMALKGTNPMLEQALNIVPSLEDVRNYNGLNVLQLATLKGDVAVLNVLLENGVRADTASVSSWSSSWSPLSTWSPLSLAALKGNVRCTRRLLDSDPDVDKGNPTALQVASAAGHVALVELLLAKGADVFKVCLQEENVCLGSKSLSSLGQHSPIALAAMNGRKSILYLLIQRALKCNEEHWARDSHKHELLKDDEVLSLHEILAEAGSVVETEEMHDEKLDASSESSCPKWTQAQKKSFQSAMYHSAECQRIDLTLNIRNLGIPFTLSTWLRCLTLVMESEKPNNNECNEEDVYLSSCMSQVEELLQDFDSKWIEQHIEIVVKETLPLLFNLMLMAKNNDATLILIADIFAACLQAADNADHADLIPTMATTTRRSVSPSESELSSSLSRIDPKFVNNPELSDVHFIVENRVFYGHKLVLMSASQRFQSLIESASSSVSCSAVLHIHDIRYEVFANLMNFVYGCDPNSLRLTSKDTLDLLAASSYFELPDLLRHCERLAASHLELDNVLVFLVHAKVYEASRLLHFCLCFVLRHLAALITFDEGVKRLLFSRNHDTITDLKNAITSRLTQAFAIQPIS